MSAVFEGISLKAMEFSITIENENKFSILGILDSNCKENNILGYKILGGDNLIPELVNENTYFLITVGQIKNYSIRKNIAKILLENKHIP